MGDGSSPGSLSHAGIRRTFGCRLPDAILHGKRSLRPHSRAVQRLAAAELSSEAFQLASAGVCATGLQTRLRHDCDCSSASSPLSAGSAAAFDGALARCHGSRLLTLRLPFVHRSAVPFLISPTFGRFSRVLPKSRVRPDAFAHFVPPFGVFPLADRVFSQPPESTARAGATVATFYPLGNCVSPRLETRLNYLTRFGTASYRSLSLSPFFAFTDSARTPPEELVNPASNRISRPDSRGWANQPDSTFPQSPGIIPETFTVLFRSPLPSQFFQ